MAFLGRSQCAFVVFSPKQLHRRNAYVKERMEWGPCFHGVPMSNLGTQSLVSFFRKNWVSESLVSSVHGRNQQQEERQWRASGGEGRLSSVQVKRVGRRLQSSSLAPARNRWLRCRRGSHSQPRIVSEKPPHPTDLVSLPRRHPPLPLLPAHNSLPSPKARSDWIWPLSPTPSLLCPPPLPLLGSPRRRSDRGSTRCRLNRWGK